MKNEYQEKSPKGAKIAMGFIMLVIIALLLSYLFADHYLNMINRESPVNIAAADSESFSGAGNAEPANAVEPLDDEKLVNIMLIGQDRRPGEERQRSDSMILLSVNPKTKEVAMVSFLRDLYVELPGDCSSNRLNTAYALGGFELLKQTIRLNFGVSVDGCLGVDFDGFRDVIDTVGGVDIELSAEEAKIVGGGAAAGMNHLNGSQALEYARIRKLDSDFGRTERQRKLLSAVLASLKGSTLKEITALAESLLPCMTSDMSNAQIMSTLLHCYTVLDSDVNTCYVPEEGMYRDENIDGMAVLLPDRQMIRDRLENCLPL